METGQLICKANHWTGFYMVGTSVMKELQKPQRLQFALIWCLLCVLLTQKSIFSTNFAQLFVCQVVSKLLLFLVGYPLGENLFKVNIGDIGEKSMENVLLFAFLL